MIKRGVSILVIFLFVLGKIDAKIVTDPVDYVSTLVGSESKHALSTGNTYPAIAMPWGMNFWTPQTGVMGDGWAYVYSADKIRGFKQTHQPSPWINDYGQFSIMPITGKPVLIRIKEQVGFLTRQRLQSHIIIVFILLILM